jgi:hypothetical protein
MFYSCKYTHGKLIITFNIDTPWPNTVIIINNCTFTVLVEQQHVSDFAARLRGKVDIVASVNIILSFQYFSFLA